MGTRRDDIRSKLLHLSPATLRGRLTLTVVAVNLTVILVVVIGNWTFGARRIAGITESDSIRHLEALQIHLEAESERTGGHLSSGMFLARDASETAATDLLEDLRSTWAPRQRPDSLVWVGADGAPLGAVGDRRDTEAMAALVGSPSAGGLPGVVRLPTGPAIVAAAEVATGVAPARGTVLVARPVRGAMLDEFQRPIATLLVFLSAPSAPAAKGRTRPDVGAFTDIHIVRDFRPLRLNAILRDALGRPVARVTMVDDAEPVAAMLSTLQDSTIGVALVVAIVGLGTSAFVAGRIRHDLETLACRVRRQAGTVLDGQPCEAARVSDEGLAREVAHLGEVFDELLIQLSERQTSLARTTRAAQETEASFRSAINDSAEAKLLVRDGVIRIANPAATACFGIPTGLLSGHEPEDAFRDSAMRMDEDGRRLDWDLLVALAVEEPVIVRYSRAGQGDRWLEITASTRFSEPHYQTLVTARDITELRRVEELRTEIVSIVSHDLRSPLTVMTGYLDLIAASSTEPVHEKAVAEALRQAERMAGLLDDLLSATRAEELFAPKVLLPVSLADLAADVARSLAPTAPSYRLITEAGCRGVVLGEERRLRQALVNLVTNAVKYSPSDSDVRLVIECEGPHVRLAVEDEGPGIPAADRRRVFDRFIRLKNGGANRPGFGLGLYIVRLIAENHGGSVFVEQAASGGARFVLQLPLASDAVEPVRDVAETAGADGGPGSTLPDGLSEAG